MNAHAPTSIEEVQAFVREHEAIAVRGAGTKTGLTPSPLVGEGRGEGYGPKAATAPRPHAASTLNGTPHPAATPGSTRPPSPTRGEGVLDMTSLRGIVEYEPSEFTFTALAGTPLREIAAALSEHGQYLPFDPPLVEGGATLGGTVAAGLSGPGRLRYGGLRDFIIGVRFIDGRGTLVHGGGKVVKNAAGFDLPKLMVGSLGRLGVLVELTFKVFPRPRGLLTLRLDASDLTSALAIIPKLTMVAIELDALELEPPGTLVVRLAGDPEALPARAKRVQQLAGVDAATLPQDEASAYWRNINEWNWIGDAPMIKVPTTPAKIAALDEALASLGVQRRYSVAGNVTWIAWPKERAIKDIDSILGELSLAGLVFRGPAALARLGVDVELPLTRRIKTALDPNARLPQDTGVLTR